MSQLSKSDLQQLLPKGISIDKVLNQIEAFKKGIPFVQVEKAAVVGDGISKFSSSEEEALIAKFDTLKKGLTLLKFVPASGAASRMFKALFNFLEVYDPSEENLKDYFERTGDTALRDFSEKTAQFPFYKILQNRIGERASSKNGETYFFVKELLSEQALDYGSCPKGLLPFHDYGDHTETPFEEHLKEGANYAETNGSAKLHFTISEQHEALFRNEFKTIGKRVSELTGMSFEIGYSYQKPSTDTIAVGMDNNPFRNSDGSLLFRPGGHGALIENLNEQDADIIFIKNIDNVVVTKNADEVTKSKKILAGALLEVQQKAFEYAKQIDTADSNLEQLGKIKLFLENKLNVRFSDRFSGLALEERIEILKDKINRPIRVCGMVKNEGEPGGGPFWVKDRSGQISLQIIESAQIDVSDEGQKNIVGKATHFNPVDLVCGVKNHKGEKYDLLLFVDHEQGFITEKTKEGRKLRALELPGLWNGAMAFWNTIFVEVPLLTFNPVKTVNDLLKPSHQMR